MAFVICIDNTGYRASLKRGRRYRMIRDAKAKRYGLLRVIDRSGESYLYPMEMFRVPRMPKSGNAKSKKADA
jgi:hypothetical protein